MRWDRIKRSRKKKNSCRTLSLLVHICLMLLFEFSQIEMECCCSFVYLNSMLNGWSDTIWRSGYAVYMCAPHFFFIILLSSAIFEEKPVLPSCWLWVLCGVGVECCVYLFSLAHFWVLIYLRLHTNTPIWINQSPRLFHPINVQIKCGIWLNPVILIDFQ